MNRYWLGIGAGALTVFGVGMAGITLGKKGLHELKTVATAPAQVLREPVGALRFRLDGERIGELRSVEVNNDGSWGPDAVRLVVALDDAASAGRLGRCGIVGETFSDYRDDARFRCVTSSEAEDEGLTRIGEVRFQPGDLARPLYVTEYARHRLERAEFRHLDASFTSPDGQSIDGKASFDLDARNGRRERGTVSIHAGDGRALIDVRDESGKPLFQLRAGESGVSLKAADGKGAELLRLLSP